MASSAPALISLGGAVVGGVDRAEYGRGGRRGRGGVGLGVGVAGAALAGTEVESGDAGAPGAAVQPAEQECGQRERAYR